ncbi:MAG: dTMP kinase [Magnetococcales bacterium]|nr:dTMP kinase [Magnetococcales bacterium]
MSGLEHMPRFVTFEGGEGAGKSTQMRLLAERLQAGGARVTLTREPGGTLMAERIRALLVTGRPDDLDGRAELLLMLAARVEHVRGLIRPALARGEVVLCDRFADSTMAYQGFGRGMDLEWLALLNRFVLGDLLPERTLLLDIDPGAGLARAGRASGGENRFEQEKLSFHQRVRAGFLELAASQPGRFRVIDATGEVAAVAEAVWEAYRS